MFYLFGKKKEEDSNIGNHLCQKLLDDLVTVVQKDFPSLDIKKDQFLDDSMRELKKTIHNEIENLDIKCIFEHISGNMSNFLKEFSQDTDKINKFNNLINEKKNILNFGENLMSNTDGDDKMLNFKEKIKLAKAYQSIVQNIKNKINILALGPSQVGKTALVKRLFNLKNSEVTLKGGLESDTTVLTTYKYNINGVTLNYTDSPGFFDSRGEQQNKENMEKIIDFINNNKIDLILWVSKLGTLVDINQIKLLESLSEKFGYNIWKKTIVVLTHANDVPPMEYFYNEDKEYDENIDKLDAWKLYTIKNKEKWQNIFQKKCFKNEESIIPIVLAENNLRKAKKINDIYTLLDGTPILESLMLEIFKIIHYDKSPIVFLILAGNINVPKTKDQLSTNPIPTNPILTPIPQPTNLPNATIPSITPLNENNVNANKLNKNKIKKIYVLNEQQKALDNVTNKIINKDAPIKKKGWCSLI